MLFTYISALVAPNSTSRTLVRIMTEIEFPGAGITLEGELFDKKNSDDALNKKVVNLTTAASIVFRKNLNGKRI